MIFVLKSSSDKNIIPRVLPNFHKVRRAEAGEAVDEGQEEKEEREQAKEDARAKEEAKEKSAERTQAIRSSLSKLRSRLFRSEVEDSKKQ